MPRVDGPWLAVPLASAGCSAPDSPNTSCLARLPGSNPQSGTAVSDLEGARRGTGYAKTLAARFDQESIHVRAVPADMLDEEHQR